jgi:hypothetical protein
MSVSAGRAVVEPLRIYISPSFAFQALLFPFLDRSGSDNAERS